MLTDQDRARIQEIAKRYEVDRVLLFGGSARDTDDARDIDLAVEGLPASRFFSFYGELIRTLSKPVDLVDLSRSTKFTEMIRREGLPIYG